jgi:DNA-binding NtrC family response regulator
MPVMDALQQDEPSLTLNDIRQKVEFNVIQKALIRNAWNISKTAEELDISRSTLHDLINRYGIKVRGQ